MQDIPLKRRILIIAIIVAFVGLAVFSIIIAATTPGRNQFGEYIRINNYSQKVKNLSNETRDAIESSLYSIVKKNSDSSFDASKVKDAVIREGSDTQEVSDSTRVFTGVFIVDMESIRQSFQVQYSYAAKNTLDIGGNPIVMSCLPKEKLRYGDFKCIDFVSQEAGQYDTILQYLPYQNFTFKISPDATAEDGSLTLVVTFTIPESDLAGDVASRTAVISSYKKQVAGWLSSKDIDPTLYKYTYNYTDTGELISPY